MQLPFIFLVFLFLFPVSLAQDFDCGCLDISTVRISVVIHKHPDGDDVITETVRGIRNAAKQLGIDNENFQVQYPGFYSVDGVKELISAAVASKPDALLFTIPSASIANHIAQTVGSIPLYTFHTGQRWASLTPSRLHIGMNETKASYDLAQKLVSQGLFTVLCLNDDSVEDVLVRFQELATFMKQLDERSTVTNVTVRATNVNLATVDIQKGLDAQPGTQVIIYQNGRTSITTTLINLKLEGMRYYAFDVTYSSLNFFLEKKLDFMGLVDSQPYSSAYLAITTVYLDLFQAAQFALKTIDSGPSFVETDDQALALLEPRKTLNPEDVGIRFVTHGNTQDSFWVRVEDAINLAADLFPVFVHPFYTASFEITEIENNILGIETEPTEDFLMATNPNPEELDDAFRTITKPFATLNAGLDAVDDIPVLYHVGSDESLVGIIGGEEFLRQGRTYVACLNHFYGHTGLAARCAGLNATMSAAGYRYIEFILEGGNIEQFKDGLIAELEANPEVDGLFTMGAPYAIAASEVINSDTEKYADMRVGTVDVSLDVLLGIYAGNIYFSIDQQEFLQGFAPVVFGYLRITNQTVFLTKKMNSGPLLIVSGTELVKKICINQGRLNADCDPVIVLADCSGLLECPDTWTNQKTECTCYEYTDLDSLRIAVISVLVIFACLSLVFLGALFILKDHPLIKSTSPFFSMLMVFSAFCGYLSSLLWVVELDDAVCALRVWFTPIFFGLMLSSMVAKTWRVHKIFQNQNLTTVDLSIMDLMSIVLAILFIDIVILAVWQGTSDFSTEVVLESDQLYENCVYENADIFAPILIVEKGLLIIYSCYLAFTTRGVFAAFKDSSNITFAVLSFSLVLCLCVPLYILTYKDIYSQLVIPTIGAILLFTCPVLALFLPRLANIFSPPTTSVAIGSTGKSSV